jgi:hypothetical protein
LQRWRRSVFRADEARVAGFLFGGPGGGCPVRIAHIRPLWFFGHGTFLPHVVHAVAAMI